MTREYKIIDEAGLHARPASVLVQTATKFPNESFIEFNDKKLTLKSIMAVMSLGIPQHSTIRLTVEGDDAEIVFAALEKVLNTNNLI